MGLQLCSSFPVSCRHEHHDSSVLAPAQSTTWARPQARALYRQHGIRIDRTERVANSLGNLAGVATRLRALPSGVKVGFFGQCRVLVSRCCLAQAADSSGCATGERPR